MAVQIHERSRSLKSAFAVVRDTTKAYAVDTTRFFHALGDSYDNEFKLGTMVDTTRKLGSSPIGEFQWRIGGRYYPAQPVRCRYGGAEAFVELLKSINYLGDYTCPTGIAAQEWAVNSYAAGALDNGVGSGNKFIMACEFENADVTGTISGINGEEQSDLALTFKCDSVSGESLITNKQLEIFVAYDCLLIIKDGNVVELVM